ncbi:MAG: YraN family protein [Proteobacteria bacterium]|nr:YraN family protein [Pseudomonadota bacterium]MDA1063028.1 YraN family protein [Pseudomonadota bacterium]
MVRAKTRDVGANAENLALTFLREKGLTPIQRNFQCRLGELDLIMLDDKCLVVVEVRFRGSKSFVSAGLTIDRRKQQKLIRTTALYLAWNPRYTNHTVRFDVVGIDVNAHAETHVEWIRDAFRPVDASL